MKPANNAPAYCSIYAEFAEVFRRHGYALAIHGSLARDFDLIGIPWIENPSTPEDVLMDLEREFAVKLVGKGTPKLHGRVAFSLVFWGGSAFLDVSFMPTDQSTQGLGNGCG